MKTYRRSVYGRNSASDKVFRERMARLRAAKEQKRTERAANEMQRVEWRGRLEFTITFHHRLTGDIHTLDLRRGKRRDQFDAEVDGKPWRLGLNATKIAALIRRRIAAHIGQ